MIGWLYRPPDESTLSAARFARVVAILSAGGPKQPSNAAETASVCDRRQKVFNHLSEVSHELSALHQYSACTQVLPKATMSSAANFDDCLFIGSITPWLVRMNE